MSIEDARPPWQDRITVERLNEMIQISPRRFRLADTDRPLKAPGEMSQGQKDWNLLFPFSQAFVSAFEVACDIYHLPFASAGPSAVYSFLKPSNEDEIAEVQKWIDDVSPYVGIRDCMALSFALDYEREGGNPDNPQTMIGKLRARAKTYGAAPTDTSLGAANRLVSECLVGLEKLRCYSSATCVVAVPPSRPDKLFDLPSHLASGIASKLRLRNRSREVRTPKARNKMQDTAIEAKLDNIIGTIEVGADAFTNQNVLLIEDLYQSGITMNYVAMLLLEAGASKVFGLACEKTCRNDDNVQRRS